VGRHTELAGILSAFKEGARGILVVGPAGAGKTTVAHAFAHRYEERFPGGIFRASASWAESPEHLLGRAITVPIEDASLLVVDDAEAFDEAGLQIIQDLLRRNSQLSVILTSQRRLALSDGFHTIALHGLSRDEFQELLGLRDAFVHGQLDAQLVDRLFQISGGSALVGSLAAAAVRDGGVASLQDLFEYLRGFRAPGLVGPDGHPLTRESAEHQRIVVDVASANSAILEMLKKQPELAWKLPSRKFEEIVAEILDKQGYDVSLTPASGDGGFDIYAARKDGLGKFLYLVECKRYVPPHKVGVEIVRALYGVIQIQRATAGAIVTTSFFTAGAKEFQREVQYHLHLHDYIALQKWVEDFPLSKESAP
jgi:restriction system protein